MKSTYTGTIRQRISRPRFELSRALQAPLLALAVLVAIGAGTSAMASCAGYCGGVSPAGCFCDPDCCVFLDCCADKCAACAPGQGNCDNNGPCPTCPPPAADYQYDCDVTDVAIGLTGGGVIAWAQRYQAIGGNDTITAIATAYGSAAHPGVSGVAAGDPVGWAVMTDSGNGPGGVIAQGTTAVDAGAIETDAPQFIPISGTPVSGSFYIVVWVEHVHGTYPAPMDTSQPAAYAADVWVLGDPGGTFGSFDPANPGWVENMAGIGYPTVWMLRGFGQAYAGCDFVVQPGQNIQTYINTASSGQTICVVHNPPPAPLYPPFDYQGKDLVVKVAPGHPHFYVRGPIHAISGEGPGTTLEGAVIQEGLANLPVVSHDGIPGLGGGGIAVVGSHLHVIGSRIGDYFFPQMANQATFGGGAYIDDSSVVTFTCCEFVLNRADERGGNIYVGGSEVSLTVEGTFLGGGRALQGRGGGLASEVISGVVLLRPYNCSPGMPPTPTALIGGNNAQVGGAIYNTFTGVIAEDCIIAENFACYGAGAAFVDMTSPAAFDGVFFWENRAHEDGGGFAALAGGWVDFDGCHFANWNDAGVVTLSFCPGPPPQSGRGGGGFIGAQVTDVTLVNSIVENSKAAHDGGGIFNESLIPLTLGPGLTLRQNVAERGGALFNEGFLEVIDLSIHENEAHLGGGGYNMGHLHVKQTAFVENEAVDLTNTVFVGGGGIFQNADPDHGVPSILIIEDSDFEENVTSDGAGPDRARGGGIHSAGGTTMISTSVFAANLARGGGALYLDWGHVTVDRTMFLANGSNFHPGGAIFTQTGLPTTIVNSLFVHNETGASSGGGVYAGSGDPQIINSTFHQNLALGGAAAGHSVFADGSSVVAFFNSIAWANAPMPDVVAASPTAVLDVWHSNVIDPAGVPMPGPGNLSADPQFVDPGVGNFRLQICSPSVNAGDDGLVPAGFTLDLDNNQRVQGTAVDMGAYEANCIWNLTGSGTVGVADLLFLLSCWGPVAPGSPCAAANFSCTGTVGVADLLILLANWGPCP